MDIPDSPLLHAHQSPSFHPCEGNTHRARALFLTLFGTQRNADLLNKLAALFDFIPEQRVMKANTDMMQRDYKPT